MKFQCIVTKRFHQALLFLNTDQIKGNLLDNCLQNALNVVQVCEEDQEQAFELLSAILWLGNVTFSVVEQENYVVIQDNEGSIYFQKLHCISAEA